MPHQDDRGGPGPGPDSGAVRHEVSEKTADPEVGGAHCGAGAGSGADFEHAGLFADGGFLTSILGRSGNSPPFFAVRWGKAGIFAEKVRFSAGKS